MVWAACDPCTSNPRHDRSIFAHPNGPRVNAASRGPRGAICGNLATMNEAGACTVVRTALRGVCPCTRRPSVSFPPHGPSRTRLRQTAQWSDSGSNVACVCVAGLRRRACARRSFFAELSRRSEGIACRYGAAFLAPVSAHRGYVTPRYRAGATARSIADATDPGGALCIDQRFRERRHLQTSEPCLMRSTMALQPSQELPVADTVVSSQTFSQK